jgi:hypothetical protein
MTSRASFWLTELRGKGTKLGGGGGIKLGEGKGTKLGEGKGSKPGEPCPKVRLSHYRLPIEPSFSLRPTSHKCHSTELKWLTYQRNIIKKKW